MMLLVLQRIALEAFLDILYMPVWWYSRGLLYWGKKCLGWFREGNEWLSPGLWLKNILVPMFGQYDWQGRIISFVIRLVEVIARGFALGMWGVVCLVLFLFWIVFPVVVMYEFLSALIR